MQLGDYMPKPISSPCDSIVREINELEQKKKELEEKLAKAPPSRKPSVEKNKELEEKHAKAHPSGNPSVEKEIEKITLELASKRRELGKCLEENPPLPPSELYIVKEVHQKPLSKDRFFIGNDRDDWTVKVPANMPQPPARPEEEDLAFLSMIQFAPALEAQLKPGATREVKLQVETPSSLMGTVRWIGTRSPLDVSLLLNGAHLASGTSHGYLKNRGATSLQVRTTSGGLASLSVTNTSGTTVKVKLILGALDLIHESEVKQ
jgi:hypothetical protein